MTNDIINLVQQLGFPVAVSIGCMALLGWIIRYILKDKVEDTLTRFDSRHDNLLKEIGEIKREMHLRFDQERDDTEKIKKWCAEIKSDNKIIIDFILKGK
tara:strand:+ start:114 stop:413 length:300 start_codon:yes stop_codon:yes gene_type:complete